jgi:acyl dehydratase
VWKAYETAKARHHSLFEKLDDGDTYLRAQVDRVMEEDQAILAALAGIEPKSESEAEDD